MLTNDYYFKYEPRNLESTNLDIIGGNANMSILLMVIWIFIFWVIIYVVMPSLIWYYMLRKEDKKKEANRNKIRELIIMKEVQWELEQEIEESMLNEWLRVQTALKTKES